MTENQLLLIGIQQCVLDECIRAILYSRKYTSLEKNNHNAFIAGCLTKTVIIQWCQIFGSRSEHLHWSKLELLNEKDLFGIAHIRKCTGFNEAEWTSYHGQMKEIRDKFFAHFDMDQLLGQIPSFEPAMNILLCYRQSLIYLIDNAKVDGELIKRGFEDNKEYLSTIESELEHIDGV